MIIFEDQVDDECGKSHINVSAAFALVLNEYDNDKKDNVHFQSLFILSVRVRRPRLVLSLPIISIFFSQLKNSDNEHDDDEYGSSSSSLFFQVLST